MLIAGSPLGYRHTEEALANMRNRKLSLEHLELVLTRISSEEHKTKVREANLGRKNSEESRLLSRRLRFQASRRRPEL